MDRGHYIFQGAAQLISGEAQVNSVQHSSEGSSVAQKVVAQLIRIQLIQREQRSSQGAAQIRQRCTVEGCSVAQKGAAQLRRVQLSSEGAAQLILMQHSLVGCSVAQCSVAHQGAAKLIRVQRRSGGCNVAQNGAAQPSGKIYAPGGPSSGQKGCILFLKYFFLFWGEQRNCDVRGGRAAPRLASK